jgi:hypothetical protein
VDRQDSFSDISAPAQIQGINYYDGLGSIYEIKGYSLFLSLKISFTSLSHPNVGKFANRVKTRIIISTVSTKRLLL